MELDGIAPAYFPWQVKLLEKALSLKAKGRLPHAVLIESASSEPIDAFVLHLSMLLLCDSPSGVDLCNACDPCRMMQQQTYSDFEWVALEYEDKNKKYNKNIKIEQIRNLIHEMHLTRQYERLKIAAIYPAEKMSHAAANSLLKTLEEPGEQILLLLVTHNKGRIPITVRSRCQSWVLPLADNDEAIRWLQSNSFDPEQASQYLDFAHGDPLLAVHLKQQGFADLVAQFKPQFTRYLRNELSVTDLVHTLKASDLASVQRLIEMILTAYCYQFSGINKAGESSGEAKPRAAQLVLALRSQAERQLQTDDNNLDLQLQLEDVLISCKRIITRRTV